MRRLLRSYYLLIVSSLLLLLAAGTVVSSSSDATAEVEITPDGSTIADAAQAAADGLLHPPEEEEAEINPDGSIIADAQAAVPPNPPEEVVIVAPEEFLRACTQGDTATVQAFLKDHPDYVHGRSPDGETCLHLTGIYGHAPIVELVLKAGGDPNIRSTFASGLRMTPLSWYVYGGHQDAVQVLLEHGAHVNLDFDSSSQAGRKVTVYDVLMDILDKSSGDDPQKQQEQQAKNNGMNRYWEIKQVLEKYGAKRYADLVPEL